jgi:hypothetical protein
MGFLIHPSTLLHHPQTENKQAHPLRWAGLPYLPLIMQKQLSNGRLPSALNTAYKQKKPPA